MSRDDRVNWPPFASATLLLVAILGLTACSPDQSTDMTTTKPTERPTTSTDAGLESGDKLADTDLWALVDGNRPADDRINLVFASWGFAEYDEFVDLVSEAISWDGEPYLIDEDGWLTADSTLAADASMGLFAIEPWRSSREIFNVWYTDRQPETPVSWLDFEEELFPLTDVSVVTIAIGADRFNPELSSVSGFDVAFEGPGEPVRPEDGDPFANSVVVLDSEYPAGGLVDLPHELGHALFNLPDEYVGEILGFDDREDLSSWPSCAESIAEAEDWWGDLAGAVDPMLAIWVEKMDEAGFPVGAEDEWEPSVEVGAVEGGCYDVAGSVRATVDSLMNSSIPVMGSVNRRWAEQILDLWSSPTE